MQVIEHLKKKIGHIVKHYIDIRKAGGLLGVILYSNKYCILSTHRVLSDTFKVLYCKIIINPVIKIRVKIIFQYCLYVIFLN